jgi:hypothetical protein
MGECKEDIKDILEVTSKIAKLDKKKRELLLAAIRGAILVSEESEGENQDDA